MCKPASLVLTRDKIFWSIKTDSHEDIIEEHSLNADGVRGPNIARVEITPPDGDLSKPLDEWNFQLDQDILPDWADVTDLERRTRLGLVDWAKAKIIKEGHKEIREGAVYALGSATVEAYKSATVTAYGSATVTAYGSATVRAHDSATVTAYNSATVTAYDSATVRAFDSATVEAYDSATVKAFDATTVTACGSATVKAYGSATVTAYNSATVAACRNQSVIIHRSSAKPPAPKDSSIVIVRKGMHIKILAAENSETSLELQ